jgi:hypothetical protein
MENNQNNIPNLMNVKYFPNFIRINYPGMETESNENLIEYGIQNLS